MGKLSATQKESKKVTIIRVRNTSVSNIHHVFFTNELRIEKSQNWYKLLMIKLKKSSKASAVSETSDAFFFNIYLSESLSSLVRSVL